MVIVALITPSESHEKPRLPGSIAPLLVSPGGWHRKCRLRTLSAHLVPSHPGTKPTLLRVLTTRRRVLDTQASQSLSPKNCARAYLPPSGHKEAQNDCRSGVAMRFRREITLDFLGPERYGLGNHA